MSQLDMNHESHILTIMPPFERDRVKNSQFVIVFLHKLKVSIEHMPSTERLCYGNGCSQSSCTDSTTPRASHEHTTYKMWQCIKLE